MSRKAVVLVVVAVLIAGASVTWALFFSLDADPAARELAETAADCPDPCAFRFGPTDADVGLVLYPGAGVEPAAYAPLAAEVAAAGFLVAVHRAPLGLAVLDSGGASVSLGSFDGVGRWAVGGHSLGGAMAGRFAAEAPEVDGLVLLAAYPEAGIDLGDGDLAVLSIYGTEDPLTTRSDVLGAASRLPTDTEFVEIPGGNHAQFGSYGSQPRDADATIEPDAQRQTTVSAIVEFLTGLAQR